MNIETATGSYHDLQEAIRLVRTDVFVREQAIPAENEYDDRDPVCLHAVVYHEGQPVGTGRLDLDKDGKVGRVAVLEQHRRCGHGTRIMQAFEKFARVNGHTRIWFHAQLTAVAFYQTLGYVAFGDEFEEEGIAHVAMEKDLRIS